MKQKNSSSKLSIQAMLSSIDSDPQQFWAYLQSCNPTKRREALRAWHAAIEQKGCGIDHPINRRIDYLLGIEGIFAGHLEAFFNSKATVTELNPPRQLWIQAVLLPLEIQFNPIPREKLREDLTLQVLRELRGANKPSLEAASTLLTCYDHWELCPDRWQKEKWPDLQTHARFMLNLICDIQLAEDMIDVLLHTDAAVEYDLASDHLSIRPTEAELAVSNAFSHKQLLQAIYNKRAAQGFISETDFFSRVDISYKTDQGFAAVFHSPGVTITSSPPGTVAIELPDDCWYFGEDHDSPEAKKARENGELAWLKVCRAYNLRHLLASNLFVREKENFKASILFQDQNHRLTFHDFFVITSYISAFFMSLNAHRMMSSWQGLFTRSRMNIPQLVATGEILEQPLIQEIVHWVLEQSPESSPEDWDLGAYLEWSSIEIATMIQEVDDLRHLPIHLITKCFDLIANRFGNFRIPLMIRNGDNFILPWDAWSHPDLLRWLFEDFYTAYIYESGGKRIPDEKKRAATLANLRESQINQDIATWLKTLTPFTAPSAKYRHQDPGSKLIEGECDAIAWFPNESALLVIQLKLSNTTKTTHQKRNQWVATKLQREAAAQVLKDRQWLQHPQSRPWLQDSFAPSSTSPGTESTRSGISIPPIASIKVHHLTLTDNYYHDHQPIDPGDGNPVTVISLFELAMLLRNEDIFEPLSHDWFRERLIRIGHHYPEANAPYSHADAHAMSMAANQPQSAERAALQAFIEAHPTSTLTRIHTVQQLLADIASNRFWSLISPLFSNPIPRVREIVCLKPQHWRELVG